MRKLIKYSNGKTIAIDEGLAIYPAEGIEEEIEVSDMTDEELEEMKNPKKSLVDKLTARGKANKI